MKKIILLLSVISLMLVLTFSASAENEFKTLDGKAYTEDENTKIIDGVVYRLCTSDKDKHYDVYDWFDSEETFESLEEINIVPEIDGTPVMGIMCKLVYNSNTGFNHNYADVYHNYSVKKITIPDTIKKIGDGAFSIFDGLEELVVPASVDLKDNYHCFDNMDALKRITFLGDVPYVYGFINKDELESVTINGYVTQIGADAFKNCSYLKSFKVLGYLENQKFEIGTNAFKNCISLKEFVFPKETKDFKIGKSAFEYCTALKNITFPEKCGNITIGEAAFMDCQTLKAITLPEVCGNFDIGKNAFYTCKAAKTLTFPKECGNLNIGERAFGNLVKIKAIEFPAKSGSIVIGKNAFDYCYRVTTVKNTGNIVKIYAEAFSDCEALKNFTISAKTTLIGKKAFYECRKLKTVNINSNTKLPEIYANAFGLTSSNIIFNAKNENMAKELKTALKATGMKKIKIYYIKYI